MRKTLAISVVTLTAVLGLAACSSDDSKGSSSTTKASSPVTAPVTLAGKVNNKGTKDISKAGDSTQIELEADDFYFNPTFVKAAPGQKVEIELKNEGGATHTFTSPTLDVDREVAPGAKASFEVTVPASGTVGFYCRFHRSSGMQGAFFTGSG